jgi:hypothetical protein
MFPTKNSLFLLLIPFLLFSGKAHGQYTEPGSRKFRYQLMGFGAVSFYSGDDRVISGLTSKMGGGLSFRVEIHLLQELSFVAGLEAMSQGFSVDTYYFAPGYSVLYDKNYHFQHDIRIYEATLPLLFKESLAGSKEDDSRNNLYLLFGYELKYNLYSQATITDTNDGAVVFDNAVNMPYEHQFTGNLVGHNLMCGMGFNHNILPGKHTFFMELDYRYGLSRYVYNGHDNSNSTTFHNAMLSFGVGLRY